MYECGDGYSKCSSQEVMSGLLRRIYKQLHKKLDSIVKLFLVTNYEHTNVYYLKIAHVNNADSIG